MKMFCWHPEGLEIREDVGIRGQDLESIWLVGIITRKGEEKKEDEFLESSKEKAAGESF